ncbi:hypothetical protein ACFLRO_01680 [Bacteroidota bacterium]
MKLTLDSLADKGCWISDDRVNAFISLAEQGIAEIGYHGTQPVSKNSRMFVGAGHGAFSFLLRKSDGTEHPIAFNEVDWTPSSVTVSDRNCELQIAAFQRSIRCRVRPREAAEVVLAFNLESLNLNVQGARTWSDPEVTEDSIVLSCRDRIVLNEWLKRTGPYAGDFMIPEPMRRIIFDKQVRSGEASVEDLRPEFRDSAIPLYDASVFIRIGGRDVRIAKRGHAVTFTTQASGQRDAEFFILFGDQRSDLEAPPPSLPVERTHQEVVSIELPEHPAVQRFMETVPGLVDSAIVQDHGMPRATPAAYYWIWAWDSMVTGIEMLRWGDYAATRRMAAFINDHRDAGGVIPMRWTRSLEPLDTPPRGALEFLFASFVYQQALETGDDGPLIDAYPFLVNHLQELGRKSDSAGMFESSGFYPDFAAKFGRSASSVVAMEVAAHFVFARMMENIAGLLSDTVTETSAMETADLIGTHFLDRFWDDEMGFLVDSFDMQTGGINKSYPLFTMLFLQSSLGFPLIRSRMDAITQFCSEELHGPAGTSLLPSWDRNRMNEDATSSWYPHWDIYLMKILRRGGRSAEIMQWLGNVERVLTHLGYCPEFIKLAPPDLDDSSANPDDSSAWLNHGATSNLNCVTGWFRAIVEGLFGIEVDPGGLSIIPVSLPVATLSLTGLVYKGGRWNVTVRNHGEHLIAIVIDGARWEGICKIPARYYDGHDHSLEVIYGSGEPTLQFREIINAEVIDAKGAYDSRTVTIRPLGTCDVLFTSRERPEFLLNGKAVEFEFDERSGIGTAQFQVRGEVDLTLVARTPHVRSE